MKISLSGIGKKYNQQWIFRSFTQEFSLGKSYAVLGANGSGKSTLLQIIAGNITATDGNISFSAQDMNHENLFRHISFASPYLELLEEMTLEEIIRFHFHFKNSELTEEKVLQTIGLEKSKQIKNFSSGMKQRVRLALAIFSDTEILLLDEPCTNLDKDGIDWYRNLVKNYSDNRIIIVASNHHEHEYDFCSEKILLERNL